MNKPARDDVVTKLLDVDSSGDELGDDICTNSYRNPDGPEAADEITRLRKELAACGRNCREIQTFTTEQINTIKSEAREECAIAARDALCDYEWPPQDGDAQIDAVIKAIRALNPSPPSQD